MSVRLYYTDSYLREFRARVTGREGNAVYLDRTTFYPTSGGQPYDTGFIGGAAVTDVVDEGVRIAHHTSAPVGADEVECAIDWPRRFDHMQQHTGQHLLSAVFVELYGAATVSFHLGQEASTIDVDKPALDAAAIRAVEERTNALAFENRTVSILFEEAAEAADLRKPSGREGTLRIVSIEGFDRSACGGTHVRSTGEIGPVLIRKLERIRNSLRVEFLCGGRAVRRARADFEALSRAAQFFSSPLDDVPQLVRTQIEDARAAEKERRRLETSLAQYRGRELYESTSPDEAGMRRLVQRFPSGSLEELRAVAQSYTAQPRAVYIAILENPPSVLLAASEDAGIDAGKAVKAAVAQYGGRGGGTSRIAQGSVPGTEALDQVLPVIDRVR